MNNKAISTEEQELNDALEGEMVAGEDGWSSLVEKIHGDHAMPIEEKEKEKLTNFKQWSTSDKRRFFPASFTENKLIPGVYEIQATPNGYLFERIPTKTEGLIQFPDSASNEVIGEIQKFWKKEPIFRDYGLPFKRGMLLWGPPGSGKSSTIQILIRDLIEKYNGVVFNFCHPEVLKEGVRIFREIEPETPFIVLMEDIDSIIQNYNESSVLNILDGVEDFQKCIFLATTNYPERLGHRIINRPSRFDKRKKIGHPNEECRMIYFKHILNEETIKEKNIPLDKWVEDTTNMSLAHLKELVVATVILEDDYDIVIERLRNMKEIPTSDRDGRKMGFGNGVWKNTPSGRSGYLSITPESSPANGAG